MADDSSARIAHDKLLAAAPEGAEHDRVNCEFCSDTEDSVPNPEETPVGDTLTEGEVQRRIDAAVDAATAPLKQKIEDLESVGAEAELEDRIEEATAPLRERVAELESDLEAKDVELKAAKDAHEADMSYLGDLAEQDLVAQRRDARVAEIKDSGVHTAEFCDKMADTWAAMGDEEWATKLAEVADAAANRPDPKADPSDEGDPNEDPAGDTVPGNPLDPPPDPTSDTDVGSPVTRLIHTTRDKRRSA